MQDAPRTDNPTAPRDPLPVAADGATAGEVAHRCAAEAARIMREAAGATAQTKGASAGGRRDVVTVADPAIERAVIALLTEAFPDHAVLGEETGGHAGETAWRWVIDPIDGTRNFSAGFPLAAFNLALYRGDTPRLALTLDPFRDELFYAEAGGGATLNGAPLSVTHPPAIADAMLGVDLGLSDTQGRALLGALHGLFPGVQALRIMGTVALGMAYVAAGRLDAYMHPSAFAWDFAPGVLLVREAGGVVSQFSGDAITLTSRSVIASGPAMHGEMVARFGGVAGGRG